MKDRSWVCARHLLRWVALGAALPALWACTSRKLEPPEVSPQQTFTKRFPQTINRDVDLLFLIDDSNSMKASQENLLDNFPEFMRALERFQGGLPNVHIAVISSDMGDGGTGGCTAGKGGIFQYAPRGACTATNLQAGATFIKNVGGQANYSGNLEDVFTCMAALGEGGCGFEHQFAAITRALGADGQPPPAENQGFLRDDAYLAIVLITNEDDCSAATGIPLFTDASSVLMSQLGPRINFRCNEWGHICDGAAPNRNAPTGAVSDVVTYQNCVSAEGNGLLKTVAETAAQIKALKADPAGQIVMAAITGPKGPYQVRWKAAQIPDTGPWPEIAHSCTSDFDGSYADPSVRVTELVEQFGGNGALLSICDEDFTPALQVIAQKIEVLLKPPCIEGQIANKPDTSVPDCTVVSHTRNGSATVVDEMVPRCADTGGAGPCWDLVPGAAGTCAGQIVQITPAAGAPPPTSQDATVDCALCIPGVSAPERGCP
jgi:hypothetical protein